MQRREAIIIMLLPRLSTLSLSLSLLSERLLSYVTFALTHRSLSTLFSIISNYSGTEGTDSREAEAKVRARDHRVSAVTEFNN